jgi:hypothetical protein
MRWRQRGERRALENSARISREWTAVNQVDCENFNAIFAEPAVEFRPEHG